MKTFKTLSRTLRIPLNRRSALRRLAEFHARTRSIEEMVEWAMDFGGHGFFKVQTLQVPAEITGLAKAVAALQPRVILEIGTARGGTLLLWANIASEHVISCDLQDMSIQRPLYEAFPGPGSACRVTLLSGDSHSGDFRHRVIQALGGAPVDFLFIDGDHREAGVTADYQDYRGLVRPGGLIAFHDIVERQREPGNEVYQLWRRLKTEAVTEELIADPAQIGYGIGLVRVPGP